MINDLGIVFKVYLISLGLQFLLWPWVSKWFKGLTDGGWALGRVLGLLAISLPIWFVGHVFPVNTDLGIAVMILVLMLMGLKVIKSHPGSVKPAHSRGVILLEEGLFLFGLVGLSLVRGFQPDILGLEKFMDFGFIKQYLISSKLPANDMWLAGESINYYSFGHFMVSILVRIWGEGLAIGYNLMLAWILGTSLALAFSIVINIGGGVAGGLMGSLLTCLGGNSHILWHLVKNKGFAGYWYADATRFIENTIHEFPGYSFVVSDLHAHLLGLPIVLAFILILVGRGVNNWLALGVLMGTMAMTNTWDVAVYGLLLGVFVLVNFKKVHIKNLFLMIGVAGVVALPWLLNFKSFSDGVSLVSGRSPLWQMMVLWGGHIIVAVIAIFMARKDSGQAPAELDSGRMTEKQQIDKKRHSGDEFRRGLQNLMVLTLGITAILLLLIPEVVYVKDIYGSHQRANTMFKLTYQAFIMMGLLFGWVMGRILAPMDSTSEEPAWECGHSSGKSRPMRNPLNRSLRMTGIVAIFVLWLGFMLFPLQAFSSYYGGFKNYKGLDGLTWLKKDTEKWGMIEYLEKNKDGKNLLEAVGDSYSKLNSVSAFSGTPTVVGWRVHEWLWRGGYDVVGKREKMVKDFYETGDKTILESFNVGWIVVGVDERKEYKIDEKELLKLGEVVFSGEEGYLIKLP